MIILDSDDDKDWSGKGVVVQHGFLVLIKDANFYHEIELYPGKHVIEIFGRKRTGQPTLILEVLDESVEPISEFNVNFEESFLFKFEFEYKKTSVGYIRIYRPSKNFGTIEIVKVLVKNLDLKEDFILKKKQKKEPVSEAKSLISNDKKPKVEVSKEDERESRRLREVRESPRLQRYERNRVAQKELDDKKNSEAIIESVKAPDPQPVKQSQPKEALETPKPQKVEAPQVLKQVEASQNKSEVVEKVEKVEQKMAIPEQVAARIKQREDRLAARLNKSDSANDSGTPEADSPLKERKSEINKKLRDQKIAKKNAEREARQEYLKKLEEQEALEKQAAQALSQIKAEDVPPPPPEPPPELTRPPVSSRHLFKNRIQGIPAPKTEETKKDEPPTIIEDKKE